MEEYPFNTEDNTAVFCINLHLAQNFGGFVTSTLSTKNHAGFSLTQIDKGIRVKGPKCNKLVPWSNLRDVDYVLPSGELPVAGETKL
jgi:hypothetical protein